MPRKKEIPVYIGAGFSCVACGEGSYEGYVFWDPVTGKKLKGKDRKSRPCEKCGHQLPAQMTSKAWRQMIKERDASWDAGKPYPDERFPLPPWVADFEGWAQKVRESLR